MQPKKGDTIGNYRLLEVLGRGGFGEVWKAEHIHLPNKWEVFKFPLKKEYLDTFHKEAMLLNTLSCESIVQITDMCLDNTPYLRMEYVAPGTLETKQQAGNYSWQQSTEIIRSILSALQVIHEATIVHGDLKPSNVFVFDDNSVKLGDFGLGIQRCPDNSFSLSGCLESSKKVSGSWEYMAPEQKEGVLLPKSDIYALGVVWYQMIAGRRPCGFEPPSHFAPDCPAWIDSLIGKMLSTQEERIGSAQEVTVEINKHTHADIEAEEVNKEDTEDNSWHYIMFVLGITSIVIGWMVVRVPFGLVIFTLLGMLLLEVSRTRIKNFWPAFLFWVGLIIAIVMAQFRAFIYVGAGVAFLGGISWSLMEIVRIKTRSKQ